MKPHLNDVTLICVDCTDKIHLAERAIEKSLEQCNFGAVKLLTHDASRRHAVVIPKITSIEGYSTFCIREMHKHVDTSHALVVQWDGFPLSGASWSREFLKYDYIGAPWLPWNVVGNGGFSLRSKRLMRAVSIQHPGHSGHPEDTFICNLLRPTLESLGLKFAPLSLASRFAFEGRSYDGQLWNGVPTHWAGQFGFHSYLTPFPANIDRPMVYHHTGDIGDVIYSLPVVKALGGGVYFFSPDNRFPYPKPTRQLPDENWCNNVFPLVNAQPYIWGCHWTHSLPYGLDLDFNSFRQFYKDKQAANFQSIFSLHQRRFGVAWPEDEPWLTVDRPAEIPGRPIVVSRTARYWNDKFPWYPLVQKYGDRMVFVGTEQEATIFQGMAPPRWPSIPWQKTSNLLELARVVAGAKVFIGNQSTPMAIALGLGKNIIQEVWPLNANCILKRTNAIYWRDGGEIEIPPHWL